jgi:hypothetical protein
MEQIIRQYIITMKEITACEALRDFLCTRREQFGDPLIPTMEPPYFESTILYEMENGKWYIKRPYKHVSFGSSSVTYPEAYIEIQMV